MHFALGQILALGALGILSLTGEGRRTYPRYTLLLTTLTAIGAALILWPVFLKDQERRRKTGLIRPAPALAPKQVFELVICGCALAHYGNILLLLLRPLLPEEGYSQQMSTLLEENSFPVLVLCLGILAPIGEEVSFRLLLYLRLRDQHKLLPSLLVSSLVFGIYHGNLQQAIYASIIGVFFALGLEFTGSIWGSILLHVSANIWSLFLSIYAYQILGDPDETKLLLYFSLLMLVVFTVGGKRFYLRYRDAGSARWI